MAAMDERPRPPNPALPYREDCWSEDATEALVEAWGTRYLELNRGNLRQKDWQEVADAVNGRPGASRRSHRTDVQCKNRIDTLKRKYKSEKARVASGAVASQWPFYSRLDDLIGSITPAKRPAPSPSLPVALPLPWRPTSSPLPVAAATVSKRPAVAIPLDDSIFQRSYMAAAAAAAKEEVEEEIEEEESSRSSRSCKRKLGRGLTRCIGGGNGIQEVVRAIEMFGEIYERVEEAKHQHLIEMEKQRMEFAKWLEVQRMQLFADCQIQFAKVKRHGS
ncbi:trihelix transcription factor ASIL2-like [Dioscorea cayenensis subsp. rotundata]|uniref:Trihelix transcription factor ASIL2-like n=1 Tax=Dioscorea cayennensis subsp. rotundata TaxID=55577 RepID=A0AB40B0F4_DIOCR|nr:trihelix transcription factor ASIL2-like [Dioscorea cayenensis subsp. rotundata]XP_039120553.1 trihelix transcription factor ASIL2-like [Dioscorea cayenensis subsp. rotundata]